MEANPAQRWGTPSAGTVPPSPSLMALFDVCSEAKTVPVPVPGGGYGGSVRDDSSSGDEFTAEARGYVSLFTP
jgi:hypothetical protein